MATKEFQEERKKLLQIMDKHAATFKYEMTKKASVRGSDRVDLSPYRQLCGKGIQGTADGAQKESLITIMVKILPATPFRLFKADGKGFFYFNYQIGKQAQTERKHEMSASQHPGCHLYEPDRLNFR